MVKNPGIPLNRPRARNALNRVMPSLTPAVQGLATRLLELLDDDGTVSVQTVHQTLFPMARTKSASAMLSKLLGTVAEAAQKQNLAIGYDYVGAKNATIANRRLAFTGPAPGLTPDLEGLAHLPGDELIPGQLGTVLVGERYIALMTFNDNEFAAVRNAFWANKKSAPPTASKNGVRVDELGVFSGLRVLHYHSGQTNRESQRAAEALRAAYQPLAIIAVGIAFGADAEKQRLSQVLVSKYIIDYEVGKVHRNGQITPRGARPKASRNLLDALGALDQRQKNGPSRAIWPELLFGGLLSGEKLLDNYNYRESLKMLAGQQDDIVGGEMEAVGVHTALDGHPTHWVVIKAICDWGDGSKGKDTQRRQKDAAANAAQVVRALLEHGALYPSPGEDSSTRPGQNRHVSIEERALLDNFDPGHLIRDQQGLLTTLKTDTGNAPEESNALHVNAFEDLNAWLADADGKPLYALLGEYGMGKTTTCQRLACDLQQRREHGESAPIPLYFDLRKVERLFAAIPQMPEGRVPTLKEAIEDCLKNGYLHEGGEPPTYDEVLSAIDTGALVIFDGLDEVLSRLTDAQGLRFTANLLKVLPEAAARRSQHSGPAAAAPRVLLSCRTQFFRNLSEQNNHLTGEHRGAQQATQYRAVVLAPFSDAQILAYLDALFPQADTAALLRQIESVHNLRELAGRPFTLKLVAQFLPRIEHWRAQGRPVTGVTLYREVAQEWLIRDKEKQSFQPEDKMQLAGDLAAELWRAQQRGLSARALEDWLDRWLAAQPPHASFLRKPRELLHEDLRNSTFLRRIDGANATDSRFEFAHTSLQEFFLADYLFRALNAAAADRNAWALPRVSDETLDFLGQMLAEQGPDSTALARLSGWRAPYLAGASELQLRYALRAAGRGWPLPITAGMDLRGADLTESDFGSATEAIAAESQHRIPSFSQADFRGAVLRRCRFWNLNLEGARFENAIANQAEFLSCRAARAQWAGADLAGAIFRNSDFGTAAVASTWHGVNLESIRFIRCVGAPTAPTAIPADAALVLAQGHSEAVTGCAWSPDGHAIVSASGDTTLRIWDAETGACRSVLRGHENRVTGCAWSPDGHAIVSANEDKTLRIWDPETGACRSVLRGHENTVTACAWSPDGHAIVSANEDKTLRIWDAETGACRSVLRGHENTVTACAWSPDGHAIVSANEDKTLRIWDPETGACRSVLPGHEGGVTACAWSPDSHAIVSASEDKTLRIWEAETGACRSVLRGHEHMVTACAWSPDGHAIVSASWDTTLRIWEAETGACRSVLRGHKHIVTACAWSPDSHAIVSASFDKTLRIWEAETGACRSVLPGHEDRVIACAWSPDGHAIVSASFDRTLRIWDPETGACRSILRGHEDIVIACAWSPDGHAIVSASWDKTLRIWDAETGACRSVLRGHERIVTACAWSPDGHAIVSASRDKTLRIWDAETGACRRVLRGHENWVTACAWSPDGHAIVSASFDRTLRIWDAETGACRSVLRGHESWVSACAWPPDGHAIVSASRDKTLRIWDANTGICLLALIAGRADGAAAWRPARNQLLYCEGTAWRDLAWSGRGTDGRLDRWPLEWQLPPAAVGA
ncbi:MAG: NACHT domain-containing protein [Nevskia sp.]|jgi:WD40 repeat protein/nucleoside phosphorylase/uncharacterized protein YjbI with pentapeptide repeats|nr:NACHT domain-containing protein [Nevskia sp.]